MNVKEKLRDVCVIDRFIELNFVQTKKNQPNFKNYLLMLLSRNTFILY